MNKYLLTYFVGLSLGVLVGPKTLRGKLIWVACMVPVSVMMIALL